MEKPLRQEYAEAMHLLKEYKVCGNGNITLDKWNGHGCGEVFPTKELTKTVQYGQTYYWCPQCYPSVKDD